MKRPPKQKSSRRGKATEPSKLSRTDRIIFAAIVFLLVALVAGMVGARISHEKAEFAKSLTSTIDDWRETYHLTDAQARRILEIEFAFHGNGNRFTKPGRSPGETLAHHAEMAAVMNAADGERFLKDQNSH